MVCVDGASVFLESSAGDQRLRNRARELADMFPLWSFPPALPWLTTGRACMDSSEIRGPS